MQSGKVAPVIDRTYKLSEVPEAIRYLEEGRRARKSRDQFGIMIRATFTIAAIAFICIAAASSPPVTFESPCERREQSRQASLFFSRSHDAVIRVDDDAGSLIETHEHAGDFKEP